jgi:hypothetical protein
MFGTPQWIKDDAAVFHTVWRYVIKDLNGRKKAHFAWDDSPRSGWARILDETYANCMDQTSSCLFYGIAAAENLLIFCANAPNAFAVAPPLKQGIFIYPDCAFCDWWANHKKQPPLKVGYLIPILSTMHGHPDHKLLVCG